MNIKNCIPLALITGLSTLSTTKAETPKNKNNKPNFVIIFCDDLGYGDLSCFGHPTIKTPCLDKMASEGQKWSSFTVSASVSSPSRGGLMTGRLGVRTGLYGTKRRVLFPNSKYGIPQEEITMAEILQENGYTTGCVGKWHLGHKPENMPLQNGFDSYYGSPFSNDMSKKEQAKGGNNKYPYEYIIYDNNKIVEVEPDQTDLTKDLTAKAIEFIENNKKEPFFLYFVQPMPHWPVYASKDFQGTSARGPYGDCIEELDWSVKQIMNTLKESGLDDNTLVVFTSDNGPWESYKSLGGSSGHLREGKASVCDGGFRVPCIMWGSMVKPGIVTDMGSTLDLFPTFCDVANIDMPKDRVYDGVSLANVLTKGEKSNRDTFFYYRNDYMYAIRKGDYKMFFAYKSGYGGEQQVVFDTPELYNIAEDVEERYNLADKNPEIIKELTNIANEHKASFTKAKPLFDPTY